MLGTKICSETLGVLETRCSKATHLSAFSIVLLHTQRPQTPQPKAKTEPDPNAASALCRTSHTTNTTALLLGH